MIKDDTLINVRNRNNGTTGYTLADGAKETRLWAENEIKKITFAELKRVSYLPGGTELLRDYLVIEDPAAIEALNVGIDIQEQPEYLYTENEYVVRKHIWEIMYKDWLDEQKEKKMMEKLKPSEPKKIRIRKISTASTPEGSTPYEAIKNSTKFGKKINYNFVKTLFRKKKI